MNALIQIPFAWQKSTGAILCMVFALFLMTSGCESSSNEMTLTGTAWKLVGIVDTETGELKELEPKDCDGCYSFTFDTDSTAIGWIINNDLMVRLRPVLEVFSLSKAGGPDCYLEDAISFRNVIETIISYDLNKNELKFYYDDNKNYLLFKPKELLQSQF